MATATAVTLPDDPNVRGDVVLPDVVEGREALVRGTHDFHSVTEMVCKVNEAPLKDTPKPFLFGLTLAGALLAMFGGYIGYLAVGRPRHLGNNNPVGWAWTSSTSCSGSASDTPER